jgi:hypothetical protein
LLLGCSVASGCGCQFLVVPGVVLADEPRRVLVLRSQILRELGFCLRDLLEPGRLSLSLHLATLAAEQDALLLSVLRVLKDGLLTLLLCATLSEIGVLDETSGDELTRDRIDVP